MLKRDVGHITLCRLSVPTRSVVGQLSYYIGARASMQAHKVAFVRPKSGGYTSHAEERLPRWVYAYPFGFMCGFGTDTSMKLVLHLVVENVSSHTFIEVQSYSRDWHKRWGEYGSSPSSVALATTTKD